MHLKCSNGHEYFEGFITLHVHFLSSLGFNLHCKIPHRLYIILGNNISVLWFPMKEKKRKEKVNDRLFLILNLQFSPCSHAGDYPAKEVKTEGPSIVYTTGCTENWFLRSLPLEAHSLFDHISTHLFLKCISSRLWQCKQRRAIPVANSSCWFPWGSCPFLLLCVEAVYGNYGVIMFS